MMAGEMLWIDPITATEANGTVWPYQAAIARAVVGMVCPFDQYQGPYVVVGMDIRIGREPYAYCPPGNSLRLWVATGEDGLDYVYREDTDMLSRPVWDAEDAAMAALELMSVNPTPQDAV